MFPFSVHLSDSWDTPGSYTPPARFLYILKICLIHVFWVYHRTIYSIFASFASTSNMCFQPFGGIPLDGVLHNCTVSIRTHDIPHVCVFYICCKYVLSTFTGSTTIRSTPYLHYLGLLWTCSLYVFVGYCFIVNFPMAHFLCLVNMCDLRLCGIPLKILISCPTLR